MARWERAEQLLLAWLRPGAQVLDLGCAFGFGTARLARYYQVTGIDSSATYIERARRSYPAIPFIHGSAESLPFPAASFDAVVMLDVLEHVADEAAVLTEIRRVLKPGGLLVLSVPHRGLLARLDSLNIYHQLQPSLPGALPAPEIATSGIHRHYSISRLRQVLGQELVVRRVVRTGLGLSEILNLALLILLRGLLRLEPVYQILQYLYFGGYIAEDYFRFGRCSYHLMLVAEKRKTVEVEQ